MGKVTMSIGTTKKCRCSLHNYCTILTSGRVLASASEFKRPNPNKMNMNEPYFGDRYEPSLQLTFSKRARIEGTTVPA